MDVLYKQIRKNANLEEPLRGCNSPVISMEEPLILCMASLDQNRHDTRLSEVLVSYRDKEGVL